MQIRNGQLPSSARYRSSDAAAVWCLHVKSPGCVSDVFICGGYNGELILADLWKINLQTFQWNKLPTVMPEPAYFHCAAVTPVSATLSSLTFAGVLVV